MNIRQETINNVLHKAAHGTLKTTPEAVELVFGESIGHFVRAGLREKMARIRTATLLEAKWRNISDECRFAFSREATIGRGRILVS
jgi:hypothetical protein